MPDGLLAPRLYRAAFAPALFALIVLAFSLQDPVRSVAPELSPPGFSAARAQVFANQAVTNYGARESGSVQDARMADLVEARLQDVGFTMSTQRFTSTTLSGRRTLVNVVGIRPGPSDRRLLVIASRDGAPGRLRRTGALESGILLELARVLERRTFEHTLVLASVSGGVDGGLGADHLVRNLRGPFDAVLVLRNIGGLVAPAPVLAASDTRTSPDQRYVRTVRRIVGLEFGRDGDWRRSLVGQLIRIGFPIALGEQANMPAAGISAASISPSGEPLQAPDADAQRDAFRAGQASLRTLTTMDDAFAVEAPTATPLKIGGKLIPQWAITLLIGALLFPLLVASIDAWARARRWRQVAQRGLLAPGIALGWLLVIGFLLRAVGFSGLLDAPPLAPDPSALSGSGATVIGVAALLFAVLGVLVASGAARQATPKGGEAAFALWIVFTGVIVFVVNPIAAGFLLLLMHLMVLMLLTAGAVRRRQIATLSLLGALPLVVVAVHYPATFGIGPGGALRYAVLLESGGFISIPALIAGCAFVAAVGTALIQLWWSAPRGQAATGAAPAPRPF